MAPIRRTLPPSGLAPVDTGMIERQVLDRYGDALEHARGPRKWLLERKVRREIEDEVHKAEARARRRATRPKEKEIHLF